MTSWAPTRLSEVLSIKHGFAFAGAAFSDDLGFPTLMTPGNFSVGGGFKEAKPKTFVGEFSPEYLLTPGDVVVTMTDLSRSADTLGYSATIPNNGRNYLHNQRIGKVVIIDDERADLGFVSYLLRGREYRHHVVAGASGSTVKHTSPARIESFVAKLPRVDEQRRIASVLGTFDDLIETNLTQIASSRELAHELFARAATDQPKIPFGDIATLVRDGVKAADIAPNAVYLALDNFATDGGGIQSVGTAAGIDSSKLRFHAGDVLYGRLRPYFRKYDRPGYEGVCSTEIWVLRPRATVGAATLEAIVSQPAFTEFAMAGSGGTRMPRANWNHVATMPVALPSHGERDELDAVLEELWTISVNLHNEVAELTRARDELLPLLMSGKVRVEESFEVA
ncbi:restriction endonuclease subunit S [Microbacterium sp. MYb45]|uniref:restriction endonuclease subunit S n=1 Tax=Microbacterium sp. MYb45 TaxID=1827294 RepID=UPI0015E4949E|nr:restriction endonuclease subunit S [Microbacterium sp. MYb45]